MDNCTFVRNIANNDGGALWVKGNLFVNNSLFMGNFAEDCAGAIDAEGTSAVIIGSILANNHAKDIGGALWGKGNIIINNTLFNYNNADDAAGDLYVAKNLTLVNSTICNNTSSDGNEVICKGNRKIILNNNSTRLYMLKELMDGASEGITLDLYDNYDSIGDESILKISKSIVIDGHGHTINLYGDGKNPHYFEVTGGNVIFQNIKFANGYNYKLGYGGALYIAGDAMVTVINCSFENCWAEKSGGAIYCANDKLLKIVNCSFYHNKEDDLNGGAIFAYDVMIVNSTFDGNWAGDNGGAVYARNTIAMGAHKDLNSSFDCCFYYNGAVDDGGAVYCSNNVFIVNCVFEHNLAGSKDDGGAVWAKNDIILN
uniref:hypothetical protein n=1 Tax=uncultured Methanobrevibacter sp. TaxID=253161 RepID=UPI00374230EA